MIVVCETEAHVCEYYKCHYVLRSRHTPPCRDIEHWCHPYMNSVPLLQYDCEGCMLIARCIVIVTIALFVHARVSVHSNWRFFISCYMFFFSLVPRPRPAFSRLQFLYCKRWKAGRGLGMRLCFFYLILLSMCLFYMKDSISLVHKSR